MDSSDVAKAAALAGKTATVQAIITQSYSPANHSVVILDLAKDYKNSITAVAFSESFAKLPDLHKMAGQHVLITGPVKFYHDKPEIVLTSAGQIHVIK